MKQDELEKLLYENNLRSQHIEAFKSAIKKLLEERPEIAKRIIEKSRREHEN